MSIEDNRLDKDRKQDIAYDFLMEKIISLQILPGQYINEGEIISQLKCSRTPVREAIQRLISDKILESIPGKGTYVSKITIEDIIAIYDFRSVLDSYLVQLVAKNLTDKALTELEENVRKQREAINRGDYIHRLVLDKEFNHLMLDLARNDWLKDAISRLLIHTDRISNQLYRNYISPSVDLERQATYSADTRANLLAELKAGDLEKAQIIVEERWLHFKRLYFDIFKQRANI